MYAIIATGGKQYRVSQGDVIYVEKLNNEVNDEVTFPVLMLGGETVEVGNPVVAGASVVGKVLQQGKGKKRHHNVFGKECTVEPIQSESKEQRQKKHGAYYKLVGSYCYGVVFSRQFLYYR